MNTPQIAYLASPYTHESIAIRCDRYRMAAIVASRLIRDGVYVFSPIVHNHPIAEMEHLPGGFDYWADFDQEMLRRCDRLIVLKLDGWRESTGVQAEIKVAMRLGLEIEYMEASDASDA